jgi:cellulose synthase/poly-beta-1,6-N-acetylglucosamine synthase-like glycosyltransferase
VSIETERPPAESAADDVGLTLEDHGLEFGGAGTGQRPAITEVRGWFGPEPAQRVSRVLVVSVFAAVLWLSLERPRPWEPFLALGLVIVVIGRIRRVRHWGPFATLNKGIGQKVAARSQRLGRGQGLVAKVFRWWKGAPDSLKVTVAALLALNALIAATLLHRNVLVFLAMACLNFLALTLAPAADRRAAEPEEIRVPSTAPEQVREASSSEDRSGSRVVSVPSLRPFPTLHAPGWDTWESWDSLKPLESPRPATAEPETETIGVGISVVSHAANRDDSGSAADTTLDPRDARDSREPRDAELEPVRRRSVIARFLERFNSTASIGVLIVAGGWIAYAHPGPFLVPCVLAIGLGLMLVNKTNRDDTVRMVLAIGVVVAGIDYVSWRFIVTNWGGWWIAIPLLGAETLGAIHVLGFQVTLWPWETPKTRQVDDPTQYPIFILVPTLNEGPDVLRPTVQACLVARDRYVAQHPNARVRVIVCNDGRAAGYSDWKEVESLARSLGAACVSRRHPGGAKAGNIEHARRCFRITRNSLLVIFDADQVPRSDFLLKTVPPFADPNVGWVQTGQYYANRSNPVSRWADDQQSLFYNLLCPGKAAHNSAFICGTNVIIRAAALDEIGGLPQTSVTEDFAASIALHARWQSVYLTEVLATGLGPLDLPSYLKQQRRWAVGTLGVLRTNWRDIFLPRRGGLRGIQRVQYFLACTHYLSGIRDVVYLVCPMIFIATGVPAVRSASLGQYLSHFLPYGILSYSALWYSARGVTGLRGIVMGFGSFPALVASFITVAGGRRASFAVTAKRRHAKQSLRYLRIYILCALACLGTIIWASQVGARQHASMFISLWWVVYTLLMLVAFLWLAISDLRSQAAQSRTPEISETNQTAPYPSRLEHRPVGLRPVWNLGAAALLAVPLLLAGQLKSAGLFSPQPPKPFVIGVGQPGTPHAGVSIPAQLLSNESQVIAEDLGGSAAVVGRTLDLSDHFPGRWANRVSADGGRPWITLQFGEFGTGGAVPLSAGLPAIINGVDDGAVGRWATEIRDYGRPVYLTIFAHVDRNWSVSSGVANGGIPEDVPKAWSHVRSVFRNQGARNVVWVWAPADPLHDQQFAPPVGSIDAVLQSFVNYPGTLWGDPTVVLDDLQSRYPTKPFFVDVSVNGPSAEKSAWLAGLGRAIRSNPNVYAVLYHEGGPELAPTTQQLKEWSVGSDPLSLTAWRDDLVGLGHEPNRGEDAPHSSTRVG